MFQLEPQNVSADLIDSWNALKQQRTTAKRNRKQKLAERQARQRQQSEEAKRLLTEGREARLQKRAALKQGARVRQAQEAQTPDSTTTTESSSSELFWRSSAPSSPAFPPQPRPRRIIHDPDDTELDLAFDSDDTHSPSDAINESINPGVQVEVIVKPPEGVSTVDYDTYPSSVADTATATATPEHTHLSTGSDHQILFSSSAPSQLRIIPDSQSLLTTELSGIDPSASQLQRNHTSAATTDTVVEPRNYEPHQAEHVDDAIYIASQNQQDPGLTALSSAISGLHKDPSTFGAADGHLHPINGHIKSTQILESDARRQAEEEVSQTVSDGNDLISQRTQEPLIVESIVGVTESAPEVPSTAPASQLPNFDSTLLRPQQSQHSAESRDARISHFESQLPVQASQTSPGSTFKSLRHNLTPREPLKLKYAAASNSKTAGKILAESSVLPESVLQDAQLVEAYTGGTDPAQSTNSLSNRQSQAVSYQHSITESIQSQPEQSTYESATLILPSPHLSSSSIAGASIAPVRIMAHDEIPARPEIPSSLSSITPLPAETSGNASSEISDDAITRDSVGAGRKRREGRKKPIFKFELESFLKPSSGPPRKASPPKMADPTDTATDASPGQLIGPQGITNGDVATNNSAEPRSVVSGPTSSAVLEQMAVVTASSNQPDYFVPLQLTEMQRDVYKRIFRINTAAVQRLLEQPRPSSTDVELASSIVESADNACLHTDLVDISSATQEQRPAEQQAKWATVNSEKFRFLHQLIRNLQEIDCHIVVFAKPGRAIDKAEAFLRGSSISYSRPDAYRSVLGENGTCRVSLMASGGQQIVERADLVIGIDSTFDLNDPQVLQVRKDMTSVNTVCPAICLFAPYTTEHVAHVLPEHISGSARSRNVLYTTLHTKDLACLNSASSEEVAATVADYVKAGNIPHWVLPSIDDFQIPGNFFLDGVDPRLMAPLPEKMAVGKRKRSQQEVEGFADQIADHTAKKPRPASPTIYDVPSSSESVTRILDSGITAPEIVPPIPEPIPSEPIEPLAPSDADLLAAALDRENTLKMDVVAYQSSITAHETQIGTLQKQISALEQTITALQLKDDASFLTLHAAGKETARLAAALEATQTRLTNATTTIATLRADNAALKAAAVEASKEALQSPETAVRDAEDLRLKTLRIAELEKKLASQAQARESDFAYLRAQYEDARTKASEHADTIATLEAEKEKLNHEASGERTKLRAMFETRSVELAHEEVEKVTRERDDLKRLVQQMETERERRERRAGMAMATRASSLPPKSAPGMGLLKPGNGGTGAHVGPGHAGHAEPGKQMAVGGTAMTRVASALGRAVASVSAAGSKSGSRAGSRAGSRQGTPAR